jgi:hypothetical protein
MALTPTKAISAAIATIATRRPGFTGLSGVPLGDRLATAAGVVAAGDAIPSTPDAGVDVADVAPVAALAAGAVADVPGVRVAGSDVAPGRDVEDGAGVAVGRGVAVGEGVGVGVGQVPAGDTGAGSAPERGSYRKPTSSPSESVVFDIPCAEFAHAPPPREMKNTQNEPVDGRQELYCAGS